MSKIPTKSALALLAAVAALAVAGCGIEDDPPPRAFFGIAPQTAVTEADAERMRAGGIGSVRWPVAWAGTQPDADGGYLWDGLDELVSTAAREELRIFPFLYGTPEWLADDGTTLPVENQRQRRAWSEFLRAAVERYGPEGEYWREHRRGSGDFVPETPITEWQIWNEANFHHFAHPVSPSRYGRLVKISRQAMDRAGPEAKLVLSGLFGRPPDEPPKGMPATEFIDRLYDVDGFAGSFDGAALHAYAKDVETLEGLAEEMRATLEDNGDASAQLYITEFGWGSQSGSEVSFEVGPEGQARELSDAYDYLTGNRDDLNLRSAYWFTWKDIQGACDFCDSAGLFEEGEGFEPKPAWEEFVQASGGRARP